VHHSLRVEINRFLFSALALTGIGALAGFPLIGLCVGLFCYSMWTLWQLGRAVGWLNSTADREAPESLGIWGEVFDGIHGLQQKNRNERLQLQATIDYLHGSLSALTDAVVMIDANNAIDWCNSSSRALLGLRYPEDKERLLINLVRLPAFIRYFEGERYDEPLEIESPICREIQLQIQIVMFGHRNRLLFARDITKLKKVEQVRKDFIANVSHELRTPLTVINGYLETMHEHKEAMPAMWQRAIAQMVQQTHRMETLVRDLILLSKLESLPPPLEKRRPFELGLMMQNIRDAALASTSENKQIDIDVEQGLCVLGDQDEIHSAFSNLVFNAVKYTNPGGKISVRWWSDDGHAYFAVKDNGIGIDEFHIPRLTERFYRVDSSRSIATGGTGLGLAIVKHVLMRHGAELQVRSKPGVGSEFMCVFPEGRFQKLDMREAG
jgi:two-component system phosphate regulon sensor histidine kinase PhoR